MNLRDLKYLVTLAEEKHFNIAAKKCFVSQPGLSVQIKKLEEELGVKLLERNTKSISFTEIGNQIVDIAKNILVQEEGLRKLAVTSHDPFSGKIYIGLIPTIASYMLSSLIAPLREKFPKLLLYLVEEKTPVLIDRLEKSEIDVALLALPVKSSYNVDPLLTEEFFLAVPKSHEFAQWESVSTSDLAEQELLLLEEGHCLRDQALTFCEKMNAIENQDFRATSLETLKSMVAAGVGLTLVPKMACAPLNGVVYLPFKDEKLTRTIGMVWRSGSLKDRLCREISHVLQKVYT